MASNNALNLTVRASRALRGYTSTGPRTDARKARARLGPQVSASVMPHGAVAGAPEA